MEVTFKLHGTAWNHVFKPDHQIKKIVVQLVVLIIYTGCFQTWSQHKKYFSFKSIILAVKTICAEACFQARLSSKSEKVHCNYTWVFKACVRYFLSNFYFFTKWYHFKNYEKCFLFHQKSSFRSWDIKIFVFFPFLSTIFRLKRTNGSGIIYVMNWLA